MNIHTYILYNESVSAYIYSCTQRYIGSLAPTAAHCLGWISVATVALYGRQTIRNNNNIIIIIIICHHDNIKNQDNEKSIISFGRSRVTEYDRKRRDRPRPVQKVENHVDGNRLRVMRRPVSMSIIRLCARVYVFYCFRM